MGEALLVIGRLAHLHLVGSAGGVELARQRELVASSEIDRGSGSKELLIVNVPMSEVCETLALPAACSHQVQHPTRVCILGATPRNVVGWGTVQAARTRACVTPGGRLNGSERSGTRRAAREAEPVASTKRARTGMPGAEAIRS